MEPDDNRRFIPTPPERPPEPPPERPRRSETRSKRGSHLGLAVALALVLIVGLVAWFIFEDNNSSKSNKAKTTAVSEQGLQKLVGTLGTPVFWVGPAQGARYGFERRSSGRVYVRYLTAQMKDDTTGTLTVATYPMANAYASTLALGKKSGWKQLDTGTGGATAFSSSDLPRSVYLAQPGLNYQIEVYDPTPGRAASLVKDGRVLRVTQGERVGLTLAELQKKAASLETTIYWIGPKSGVTYEYTRNPGGNVYLRYLPIGVAVGTSAAYPTVGTYPISNAYATTRAAARRAGSVKVRLTGAEAFYSKSKPTSVFVAFPGSDYQIEVYNPVSGEALATVESGRVRPVG